MNIDKINSLIESHILVFTYFCNFLVQITNDPKKANAITHNGCFHADELFATVVMMLKHKNLILARVPSVDKNMRTFATVYDIGGGAFDHHQPGGNGERENGIKYSSFGLVWRTFGPGILEEHYHCSPKDAQLLFTLIDEDFVQSIDCIDNGQVPKVNFPTKIKSISAGLADFYPSWNTVTPELENEKFLEALQVAYYIFNNAVCKSISKLEARKYVESAINNSEYGILVLEKFMPWRTWTAMSTNSKAKQINFVIFPNNRGDGYTISTVPRNERTNIKKMLLPEEWSGLSGAKLQQISGIDNATFCHPQRHLAGARTLWGAIEMALIANAIHYVRKLNKCS